MNYILHLLIILNIYLILSLSFNLFTGYTGLITLAHAAFFGIGAYATAILVVQTQFNFFISLPLSIIITLGLAYCIGKISLAFKRYFFIVVTLGFQVIVYSILYNWKNLTGGPYGILGIPKPTLAGITFNQLWAFCLLACVITAMVFLFMKTLDQSSFCLYLKSIRENELAFISSGKNPAYYKTWAFTISGGIAGISGSLFASYFTYIAPGNFTLDESIFILSVVMIGGAGNLKGPFVGTLFMILIPEILGFIGISSSIAPNIRQIILGLLLVLLMRYRPQGILGEYNLD